MSAMTPIEQAFVGEALDAIDNACDIVNMRDGHSEYWGAEQLAMKLESMKHKVEWTFNNITMTHTEDLHTGDVTENLLKNGGHPADWNDGFMVTTTNNVNGIRLKQAVANCHVKFGMTFNTEDTAAYENGFCVGLFDEKKVVRAERGKKEVVCGRYEMNEVFTAQVKNGAVTVRRNQEEGAFDVVGECGAGVTSMYGMIHIRERDALGQLEEVFAVAMVTSIDVNGNLFQDTGVECLATALEVPYSKVVHLDLGLNRIRDKGAARIAKVLTKTCSQITTLVLSNNEIGDEGATSLGEVLGGSKITKLWLEGNMIGDEGAKGLAPALESEFCRLTLITLAWNKIEDEGAQRLLQGLANENCKVTHFTLDHNKYGEDKKTKKMYAMLLAKVPRFLGMSCGLTDDFPDNKFAIRDPEPAEKAE